MVVIAMRNHPRRQDTLEDLFLKVCALVDDWLKANQQQQPGQVASYSELFATALVGEWIPNPSP